MCCTRLDPVSCCGGLSESAPATFLLSASDRKLYADVCKACWLQAEVCTTLQGGVVVRLALCKWCLINHTPAQDVTSC